MESWKANRHKYTSWEEVKVAIREYYGDHYKSERACNKIGDLKQTGTVQKYLYDIDRLNFHAKMTDHHLINIILNSITAHLRQVVADYEYLCSELFKWKEKLLYIDFITTKFQKKEQDNRSKS